jgi:hypothetical protein
MSPSATVSLEDFVSSSVIWRHFALPQNSVPVCTYEHTQRNKYTWFHYLRTYRRFALPQNSVPVCVFT